VRILEVVDETVFFLDVAFYKPESETVCILYSYVHDAVKATVVLYDTACLP